MPFILGIILTCLIISTSLHISELNHFSHLFLPFWWFDAVLILLVIVALFSGYCINGYLFKNKQHELEELVKLRTKELKDRNERIEEQSEELKAHAEELSKTNELLTEKQQLIEKQKSALVKKNNQLSQLNATKDKYFSIIAHDLRNSFHVVLGFAELLLANNSKLPEEKSKRYLQLIYSTSKNGNYLLENLLQWSRSQTGRMHFEPISFNLLEIVDNTLKLFESDIQRKNIKINILIDRSLEIYADENMIQTILRNLLSNAIKFTYDRGSISLRASKRDKDVEIAVEDTGIGISVENQKLLFNIETNISTQGTSHEHGTGLGLILCWEFIEKHHGKLWVESDLGKGAKFKFTLPDK